MPVTQRLALSQEVLCCLGGLQCASTIVLKGLRESDCRMADSATMAQLEPAQLSRSKLTLLGLLVMVAGLGMLAVRWPVENVDSVSKPANWVRTARGWEKAVWHAAPPAAEPALHPGMLAMLVVFISTSSLATSRLARQIPAKPVGSYAGVNRRRRDRRRGDRRGITLQA